jgi:CheY-like chemotaxis protein
LADESERPVFMPSAPKVGRKTILLVEDSKLQRLAGERTLFKAGYSVLSAATGEEALRLA